MLGRVLEFGKAKGHKSPKQSPIWIPPLELLGIATRSALAVTSDGQRFLFSLPATSAQPSLLMVTLNWASGLK
jgi:hypothetical protein